MTTTSAAKKNTYTYIFAAIGILIIGGIIYFIFNLKSK
jgi:hypothetical protein